ncbi:MCP four helix bundle domain-containing protein, partial [Aeromonas salmonicida]
MNIARRLQLIALLVMVALVFLSWFSINRLAASNQDLSYVTDNTVPSISLIKEVQADFYELHALIQTHVLNTDDGKMQQIETDIADIRTAINSLLEKYKAEMLSNDEDRRLTDDDQRIIAQYYLEIDKVLLLSRQNKNTEARDYLANNVMTLFGQFAQTIERHVKFNVDLGLALKRQGEENYDSSLQTLLFIAGGTGILTLGLFIWLFNQVANPLRLAMQTLSLIQRDLN